MSSLLLYTPKAVTRRSHLRRKKGDALFPKGSFNSHCQMGVFIYEVFLPQAVRLRECAQDWISENAQIEKCVLQSVAQRS